MLIDSFEIHESHPSGSCQHSRCRREVHPTMDEALGWCQNQVTQLETRENVDRDSFTYEFSMIHRDLFVYAPTHPNWRHMPIYTIFHTTEDK